MASINKVILIGNLGRDPEQRFTENKVAITTLNLATTRNYSRSDGERVEETEWHRVTVFARLAEIANQFLRKGSQVYVEGRLRTRKYQDKSGQDRYVTEIIGESLQMLDRKQTSQQGSVSETPQRSGTAGQTPVYADDFEDTPF